MKRTITLLLIAAIACGFIYSCGGRKAPKTSPRVVMSVDEALINESVTKRDTISFGHMKSGEIVSKEIGLKNVGDTPFILSHTIKLCGCLNVDFPKEPIMPGDTTIMQVQFDSKNYEGRVVRLVTLQTSLTETPFRFIVDAFVD